MKWDYESISLIEIENKNSLLFKPLKFNQSIMKSYVMWIWINGLKFDLSSNNRREYLTQNYPISSENLVLNILNLDISKEEQEILIYFYYLSNEEIEEIYELMSKSEEKTKKIYAEVRDVYHSQKKLLLKKMEDKNYLEKLVNLSFGEGVKIVPYISLIDKKQMNLHYMKNKGVIIALGYEFSLDTIKPYDHKETLDKLKALGDETRLSIVELILEKYMSASELSNVLDLTIPTIAHQGLDNLIHNINLLNSGGSK